MIDQVKSLNALIDATKPFLAALPDNHPLACMVIAFVDAERVRDGEIGHSDAGFFDMSASVAIVHGDEMVAHYADLSNFAMRCLLAMLIRGMGAAMNSPQWKAWTRERQQKRIARRAFAVTVAIMASVILLTIWAVLKLAQGIL